MGERTQISWCDHTFNPVVGCTKVSSACDNCYAESWAKRSGHPELWNGARRRTSKSNWQQPLKWNAAAQVAGKRTRVFCASLADVFDNQWEPGWRADLFRLINATPNLDWLLLTKRPQNIVDMCGRAMPDNVWAGTTAENQKELDRRYEYLGAIDARIRFLSMEPMLGSVSIAKLYPLPHWVIVGGESGPRARPIDINWVRALLAECAALGVAFHFKQVGGLRPTSNGCAIDGREYKEFPMVA